jgi:hypothetical protein
MTITAPTYGIRINPLIASEHHENSDLIEADVEPADHQGQQVDWKHRNTIDLLPAAPPMTPAVIGTSIGSPAMMVPVPKQTIVPPAADRTITPPAVVVAVPVKETAPAKESAPDKETAPDKESAPSSIPSAVVKPSTAKPAGPVSTPGSAAKPAPPTEVATSIPAAAPKRTDREQPTPARKPPAPAAQQQAATEEQPVLFSLSDGGSESGIAELFDSTDNSADERRLPKPVVLSDPIEDLLQPMMVEVPKPNHQEDTVPAEIVKADKDRELVKADEDRPVVETLESTELADGNADLTPAETLEQNSVPQPVVVADVDPIEIKSADQADADSLDVGQPAEPFEPINELPSTLVYGPESKAVLTPDAEALSSTHRHRSPVAVDAPPLVIERAETKTRVAMPAVDAAPAIDPTLAAPGSVDSVVGTAPASGSTQHSTTAKPHRTPVHISRAQVRSLMIGGEVRRISIADKNVCQAFTNGPNELKLIGVNNGVTQLVVWAGTSKQSVTLVRTFEIHVGEVLEASESSINDRISLVNRSIADAFPDSNIEVRQYRDRLVVLGDCANDEIAKKIIRMVRKTFLIAVQDEIKIR